MVESRAINQSGPEGIAWIKPTIEKITKTDPSLIRRGSTRTLTPDVLIATTVQPRDSKAMM